MSKKKAVAGEKGGMAGATKADNFMVIDLRYIKANSYQSRGHGVIPNLNAQGYGLFTQLEGHADKDTIWGMLTGNVPEKWAEVVGLIDTYEPDIKDLANGIAANGQLQNIGVYFMQDQEGWDIVFGMCRSLARAYNYARSGGQLPCDIKAEIATNVENPTDLHFRAIAENRGRRPESPIDEAKRMMWLKKQGLKAKDIALQLGENEQNVRNRLQLLRLTKEEQERVHLGKLGQVNALNMLRQREAGNPEATAPDKKDTRRRLPTYKQALDYLGLVDRLEAMPEEEWALLVTNDVRRYLSLLCGVEYLTHKEMIVQRKEQEKKRQEDAEKAEAEAAQKAAEVELEKQRVKAEKEAVKAKEKADAAALKAKEKADAAALKSQEKANEVPVAPTEAIAAK